MTLSDLTLLLSQVIVIQVSGRKRWSVASEPSIYLSNKDQKYKPTGAELKDVQRYSEFTLCPGDILYIPRGHIHNASTVLFDNLLESKDGSTAIDLDNCPSYPNDYTSSDRLAGPSLHLTFGLRVSNEATIEALLHYALYAYFESVSSSMNEQIAITKETCSNYAQMEAEHDITWSSIFHHIVAEVARRKHHCDNILSKQDPRNRMHSSGNCNKGTAILRKSVPLMLLSIDDLRETTGDDGENSNQQYIRLKQTYLLALETFSASASIPYTIEFIQSQILKPPSDEATMFHYPLNTAKDAIICPDAMNTLSQDRYMQIMKEFDQFSRDNFFEALTCMIQWGKKQREDDRLQQQLNLENVGHI